jgi:acyl carrier protein
VAKKGAATPTLVAGLRQFLQAKLPEYMMPSSFMVLETLPLTPNGKIDRRALPAPHSNRLQTLVAPRTPTETLLTHIWAEVLGLEQVGINDNFFELGGQSLLATRVISRLRDALQLQLPLRAMFEAVTVASLAEHIETLRWAAQISTPVSLNEDGKNREEGEL